MLFGLLNAGSLLFGLIAWILPVLSIAKRNKGIRKNWAVYSIVSVTACAVSLCMQILYNNHLVYIRDWSAIEDTSYFVANVSVILLAVTIALNAVTIFVYRDRIK